MSVSGGFGLTIKIDVTGTPTAIANMQVGSIPELEKVLVESTTHGASGGYATWQATGKRKMNEFKTTLSWDKTQATHAALKTAFESNSPVNITVVSPDASETIAFSAHVTKMGRMSEQEDMYKMDVTLQPTGAPTIT